MLPALSIGGAILATAWLFLSWITWRGARQMRLLSQFLEKSRGAAGAPPLPALSVIIAARDEEEGIEATLRRLLAQSYPGLQILAVDDRSTDRTGAVLDRIAAEVNADRGKERLVVIHNHELPAGWLGKCHACHLGASRARGDWLLFMDGDVRLAGEDLLARVVERAEQERLDHVAATPDTRPMSWLSGGLMTVFGQIFILATRSWEMESDRRRGGGGVGAFNLIRRTAYERVGGHRLLRMDPTDDVKLGMLLKETGARQRIFQGYGLIFCRWQNNALGILLGLEKNFFAGCSYSVAVMLGVTALLLAVHFGPPALAVAGMAWIGEGAPAGASLPAWAKALIGLPLTLQAAALSAGYGLAARRSGVSPASALLHPLSVLLLVAAGWNSTLRTLSRGGIQWRDTFYPLADLKKGLVRPGDGRRLAQGAGSVYHSRSSAPSP